MGLQSIAIKHVERVERDDPAVGVRDVDARLFHAAHVEVMRVEELHDDDAENVVVRHRLGHFHQRQAAEELAERRGAAGRAGGGAEQLEQQGVSCEVIDPRTIRPLDIGTIVESVKKTNRVVIAEESHPICSVGAEIATEIMERAFDYLDAPVKRVSGADVPMPYAKNLEDLAIPDVNRIVAAVKEVAYID